jgi:hypothetical protein
MNGFTGRWRLRNVSQIITGDKSKGRVVERMKECHQRRLDLKDQELKNRECLRPSEIYFENHLI